MCHVPRTDGFTSLPKDEVQDVPYLLIVFKKLSRLLTEANVQCNAVFSRLSL